MPIASTNITVTESTYEQLRALKRDDESFSEVVEHGGQLVTRDRDFNAERSRRRPSPVRAHTRSRARDPTVSRRRHGVAR
ncbi:antitoxin VapB family protein [Halonotius aquaticus]|uniref:antitoxin VapB family protein n=1 Tax=Halonotius aquaticus TaxID=2216978 RepID=UPI0014031E05